MKELIRDSCFGQIVRLVTNKKFLRYPEEDDVDYWKKYLNEEKSGHAAHHGTTEPEEKSEEEKDKEGKRSDSDTPDQEPLGGYRTREQNGTQLPNSSGSSMTEVDSQERIRYNVASGVKIDAEKGKDVHIVDWYGPDDPANPQNWSTPKKFFVTFEICLLTTGVYIGSAIYSPGIMQIETIFHTSQAAATLGLTMFVLGYGIGMG